MRVVSAKKFTLAIMALMLLLAQGVYAATFDRIIAFGDSMSDNGNIFHLTSTAHKVMPLIPILPKNPPYYEGRFSNGPVWIDDLVAAYDVPLEDYAYGGAWAEPLTDSKLIIPFGLNMQVNDYMARNILDSHTSEHLYVIWVGGNDYVQGRDDVDYATDKTVATIKNNIEWLVEYFGARNVMVLNLPNLSLVPEVKDEGPDTVQNVTDLVTKHNQKLKVMVEELSTDYQDKYPEAKIIFADVTGYFNDAYQSPEKYNLKNVKEACYGGGYSFARLSNKLIDMKEIKAAKERKIDILRSPSLRTAYVTSKLAGAGEKSCANPDEYMFWDHIHPTRVVHNLMALDAMQILEKNGLTPLKK